MKSYTIRRPFLIPLGILLLQTLLLFMIVVAQGQPKSKAIILGILIIPVAGLFAESYFRRIVIAVDAVLAFRPFRKKKIAYDEITAVDTIQVKKRVFMTVSTEEHFIIISNAYADFPALVKELLEKVPADTISEDTAKMAEAPPMKSSDIYSCWFGVILLAIIMILQFVK